MTNKFDDLMYEAGLTAQGCWDEMDEYDRAAILKFGNLIVKECCQMMIDLEVKYPANLTVREIRKQFGIESVKMEKINKEMEKAFEGGVDLSGKETP